MSINSNRMLHTYIYRNKIMYVYKTIQANWEISELKLLSMGPACFGHTWECPSSEVAPLYGDLHDCTELTHSHHRCSFGEGTVQLVARQQFNLAKGFPRLYTEADVIAQRLR